MSETYQVIDWLFNQFSNLWTVIIASWVLSVPVLLCIFLQIFILIKGIYNK